MRLSIARLLLASAVVAGAMVGSAHSDDIAPAAVIAHYADMAKAMYGDAHAAAKDVQAAIEALIAKPAADTLMAARRAWIDSRPWYQQTEAFRFGNAAVDNWEGKVNAWPLDEGLIDYVDTGSYGDSSDDNPLYSANIIAGSKLRIGNDEIDLSVIDMALLEKLHEAAEVEANVTTGYHAIEFLLWGQDLNGTGSGAGKRPPTDFDTANCTGGNCDRRAQYLKASAELLVRDLAEMTEAWGAAGAARKELSAKGDSGGLATILAGMGSLSYGELAGERMKLGLILHDPEEEHDCFSDNTHNSHYYDQAGMRSIYSGTYRRRDGMTLDGPGIGDLAAHQAPKVAARLEALMAETETRLKAIRDKADSGAMSYDQMIAEGNSEGNAMVQNAIDALVAQTRGIEALVAGLNLQIKIEGSDSLDDPSAVKAQ